MIPHFKTYDVLKMLTVVTPAYSKTAEKILLSWFKRNALCDNVSAGGELADLEETEPVYVYVACRLNSDPAKKRFKTEQGSDNWICYV